MERDLQVHTEDIDRLRAELGHVVEFFRQLGYERCDVSFGWAWSTDRDKSDLAMKSVNIPLIDLDAEVRRAEDAGLGNFGRDNVWISFEGQTFKVQICHHNGIHLYYADPDEITQHFRDRWRAAGLEPKGFEKVDSGSDWRPTLGGEN